MSAKKKINEYVSELPVATPETAEALAISGGYSVKVPLSTFASKDNVKTISEALEKYKEDQGKKDAGQDRRLDKLESGVTTKALQEVSNGIDGEFVQTIIGEKTEGQQTIGVSVTIQPISTASEDNRGVAESSDVKNFVNDSLEEIDNALEDIINGEINVNILTAGNGVNIANNVISADTTILATKKDIENIKPQQSEQVQSDWNESDLTSKAYIQNKPNLHAVATSGSYNDLKDKPTINTNFVPYSDNLDAISDDLGVAWMNVGEGREFGHIYKREQGEGEKQKVAVISQDHGTIKKGTYRIIEDCPNVFTGITYAYGYSFCIGKLPYTNDEKSEVLLKVGDLALVPATKEYEPITDLTIKFYEFSQSYSITNMTVGGSKSNVGFQVNSLGSYKLQNENGDIIYTDHALKLGVFGNDLYLASDGNYYVNGYCLDKLGLSSIQEISSMEWKDVYDTSSNIPQLADVATSGDYADLANTPHLYVISCELKPTTSTDTDSYDAVMYFNILHNKDTITIDELKSMLLGKRHPATGYKGDDAIVSFVINQYDMSYRTISQENNALIGGFEIHGTYQVF